MDVRLVMFKADGTRREFPLTKSRVIIGRKNSCDLRIPLSSVSRQHCELIIDDEEGELLLRDLGSSNGTYHNSNRVQEAVLGPGDEVVIGPVVFTVMIDNEPSRIEPVRTILGASQDTGVIEGADSESVADPSLLTRADGSRRPTPTDDDTEPDLDDPVAALDALADEDDSEGSSLGEFEFLADDDETDKK